MGIIFIANQGPSGRVLMDCSRTWGERFMRMSDFIALEYAQSSMFEERGQIISDCVYIDLVKAQALFDAASYHADHLLIGWAEYIAGMLEVATQKSWRDEWQKAHPHFHPTYCGVNESDIPAFQRDRWTRQSDAEAIPE